MIIISYLSKYIIDIVNKSKLPPLLFIFFMFHCFILIAGEKISQSRIENNKIKIFKTAKSFNDLFVLKGTFIDLEQYELIVGRVSKLEVSKDGNILFLDDITKQVWLIKHDLNTAIEINPEKEIPGIQWRPSFVSFAPGGYIFIISAPLSNVVFIFNPEGKFLKKIEYEKGLKSIRDMNFSHQGDLLVCFTEHNRKYGINKIEFIDDEKKIKRLEILQLYPNDYPNLILRTANSIMCVTDEFGFIYQAYQTGPEIYKYTSNFEYIEKYKRKPKGFHKLARDLYNPNELSGPGLKKVLNMLSKYTNLENLFYFKCCNVIMLQYIDISIKGTMLDFLTTDGKYLTKGNIKSPRRIMAVQRNSMYVVEPVTDLDKNGHLANPKIIRYELK